MNRTSIELKIDDLEAEIKELKSYISELKTVFPKIMKITNQWALMDEIHGGKITDEQATSLKQFGLILAKMGVIENE